jgi:hypothetical protein
MTINIVKCNRCSYDWATRRNEPPVQCPRCKSSYWHFARRKDAPSSISGYEKGFLEGVIDGEGSLCLRKDNSPKSRNRKGYVWAPCGMVFNTDIDFLKKVQKIVGSGSIVVAARKGLNGKNHKQSYRYNFPRQALRTLLPQLELIVKEKQRILLIEALAIIGRGRVLKNISDKNDLRLTDIWKEMKQLNMRGLNCRERGDLEETK